MDDIAFASRLLIVDDTASFSQVVTRIAEEAGFQVMAVTDPAQAMRAFSDFKPDVTLLDVVMPEIDGLDLLFDMLLLRPHARIVVMSGYGRCMLRLANGIAQFHDATNVRTASKPLRRDELVALMAGMVPA